MAHHGTIARYKNDRCRCDDCKKANRDWARRQRGTQPKGPVWASSQVNYMVNPVWEPDTMTRGELMAAREMT